MEAIEDEKCRELVGHLLEIDPRKRWTAADVLESNAF